MINYSIDKYYQILGIEKNATIDDIKHAYRLKAKELHPDKNKSSEAHEQFILLTEAYECLINIRTDKSKTKHTTVSYTEWQEKSREEARERAFRYSKMQYEEFKRTKYYKNTQAVITIINHFYFFTSVLIILSPLWGYILNNWIGFFVGIFIAFISVHYWAGIFKEKIIINFGIFFSSLILVGKSRTFRYLFLTMLNLFFFFKYTLNNQLTFLTFGLVLLALYILFYYAIYKKATILRYFSKTTIFLSLIPTIFNIFFFTNFIFSSNPATEKYSFVHEKRLYGNEFGPPRLEKIAYIDLENSKYEQYNWFRMFLDFDAMKDKSEITYTFEDGLFGIRVLKTYMFNK